MNNEPKKKPLKKVRVGGVTITFWENLGENGTYATATIERSYKDKNDEWQTSNSYASTDLDKLDVALQAARLFVHVEYPEMKKPV
jgi:hypothetical protein